MLFLQWVVTFNSKVLTRAQCPLEMDLLRISKKSEETFSVPVCLFLSFWEIFTPKFMTLIIDPPLEQRDYCQANLKEFSTMGFLLPCSFLVQAIQFRKKSHYDCPTFDSASFFNVRILSSTSKIFQFDKGFSPSYVAWNCFFISCLDD